MHGSFPAPAAPAALRAPLAGAFKRLSQGARPAVQASSKVRECLECGAPLAATLQATAEFCCAKHRLDWNNRRMQRGALLYDVWMLVRYERGMARAQGLVNLMSSLARAFRDADRHNRAGRRSWRRASDVFDAIPSAYGKAGDGR